MVRQVGDFFESLFFDEVTFEKVEIGESKVNLVALNLGITHKHPWYQNNGHNSVCFLQGRYVFCFYNVSYLRQETFKFRPDTGETVGNHEITLSEHFVTDRSLDGKLYQLEGEFVDPVRWVYLTIEASGFVLSEYNDQLA